MTALTEAQLRICAHACITRYDRGEGDIATILGSYALDEKQREQVMKIILSKRSDLVTGNVGDSSSTDALNEQEETVKWYNSIFRKKTV
ncbi:MULTISPECIES: hypothetical protein [Paenibacillus]|jgi:hypothetical protein|uniref:Uncharacterized protein n=2 Tax=Paenibacillus TaxID=44249 RepID=A0ABX2ZIL4_PAEPO|nr:MULTISPECIES: hypothetical protein [Paenibacillus]MDR6777511.1 hypothetical protein [Paenibacillus peoriae]MXO78564.1 hypothetical protein [Paenibacillus sp. OT2-17]ODA11106.1 hypothetical protein A7312_22640 [Paenibacillus polymyxa]OME70223.1 hypothetical protein BK119_12765 [Paenibacillus peoriae]